MNKKHISTKDKGHIVVNDVTKIYDPSGVNVLAVEKCNFEIEPGQFVTLVGPSGCGKTTLLNIIAGFDNLTEGEVTLDGKTISSTKTQPKPGPDRVVVFQAGALFDWMTVLDNITFGPVEMGKMKRKEAEERAKEFIALTGLRGFEDDYPLHISSGMRRRVEIIRALICEPKTLLLDEPFRALDTITKSVMHQSLLDLFERVQITVMFITHDLDESVFLSDRLSVMTTRPGRIKKWITVDLPRPRDFRIKGSKKFLELKRETLEAVHEEVKKAFERGERELA